MHENQTVDFVKEKVNFVIGASILIFYVAIIVVFCNASQNSNKKKLVFTQLCLGDMKTWRSLWFSTKIIIFKSILVNAPKFYLLSIKTL